jgi:internalin A
MNSSINPKVPERSISIQKNDRLTGRRSTPEEVLQKISHCRERGLTWLSLSQSNLTEIPKEIYSLNNLRSLDLSDNNLRAIPNRLSKLTGLRSICLVGNPVEKLPKRAGLIVDTPTYLRCRNQIDSSSSTVVIDDNISDDETNFLISELSGDQAPREVLIGHWTLTIGAQRYEPGKNLKRILLLISRFKKIESLSIRGVLLKKVPAGIRKLRNLAILRLDGLGIDQLPDWIVELPLESFSATDNDISELPNSFHVLDRLEILNLSWNPLAVIPSSVYELPKLDQLRLHECYIREIPKEILRITSLKYLDISSNSISSPPEEVASKGLSAICNYWRQRVDTGVDYLCEAKLIILGEPGAGKTSLAKKIKDRNYELCASESSTEGIDVIRYDFPVTIHTVESGRKIDLQTRFRVNIWDFGGQEIYHATHQFFLTRRSVYVLVCDDRKEDTDFSYWLNVVAMLSDASSIIIVQNEKQDRSRDINMSSLRGSFPNLRSALATNLNTNRGLDQIVLAIQKELEVLPHVGVGLPTTWKRVREALEKDERDFIGLAEYLQICQKHGFTLHADKLQLSGYLHDLGICLHFQDDAILKNIVILKPAWGTDAVYRVLDDKNVITAHGKFTIADLGGIWADRTHRDMHQELLQLMIKFQLCYAINDGCQYIAPQLLSSEKPSYPRIDIDNLVVSYRYEFLPKGIITRFIVALHHLIENGLVWKSGVILVRNESRAEIIEEFSQRRITVRAWGASRNGLMAIIDEQLERLHASFHGLQYEKYLPCPCGQCGQGTDTYAFSIGKLINMAKKGNKIQCHESGDMVDAEKLVREILPSALQNKEDRVLCEPVGESTVHLISPGEVFVSYAWTDESCALVDLLQSTLGENGIHVIRDREELRYKDSIREFMRRLGKGKCIIIVISERYLKSENCMFELLEISKAQEFRARIFPIILPDANIYKATGRVKYLKHWEEENKTLDDALKTLRGDNLVKLQEDLNTYSEIRRLFDGISDTLRDMNALTADMHRGGNFEQLISGVRVQLNA